MNTTACTQSFVEEPEDRDQVLQRQIVSTGMMEIDRFRDLAGWDRAETVLDLGRGNGDYVAALKDMYPK